MDVEVDFFIKFRVLGLTLGSVSDRVRFNLFDQLLSRVPVGETERAAIRRMVSQLLRSLLPSDGSTVLLYESVFRGGWVRVLCCRASAG